MHILARSAAVILGLAALAADASARPPTRAPWTELKTEKLVGIPKSSIEGTGSRPLIIIADAGCDEAAYADFAKRHSERFTTHTLVLPGTRKGTAAPPLDRGQIKDPIWLVNAIDAVLAYAKEKQIEKPVVLGQGIGGTLAYMLAIREPQFASSYIIINTAPAPSVGGQGRIPAKEDRANEVDKLERPVLLAMDQNVWLNRVRQTVPRQTRNRDRAAILVNMLSDGQATGIRRYMLEAAYLDLREQLDAARTPILVYVTLPDWMNDQDKMMLRATFQNVAFNRPNVTLELADGCRQWMILDEPVKFDSPMLRFLGMETPSPAQEAGDKPTAPPATPPEPPGKPEPEKK